jgi:SAM-dependent methyltransferase
VALNFSDYDRRNYNTVSIEEGYTRWSGHYDHNFVDELDLRILNRISKINWSNIDNAIDLACGTGRIGKWLVDKGVKSVDGVDITPSMIEKAQSRQIYSALNLSDMTNTSQPSSYYNLAINNLAAEHLANLVPLFNEAHRLLKPNGYFIVLGFHPHFQLRGIPTHFRDPVTGANIAIKTYIHLLSDFIKAGNQTGWTLLDFDENVVDKEWTSRWPNYEKHLGHPISFLGVWKK